MASDIEFTSEAILRVFESETESGVRTNGVPLYEYMTLDYGDPEEQRLSFHIHGWGRLDLGDSDIYEDNFDGELLYGYLEYQFPSRALNFKLGRQHIFSGIINEGRNSAVPENSKGFFSNSDTSKSYSSGKSRLSRITETETMILMITISNLSNRVF